MRLATPEQCLLAQAVWYVYEGVLPIPDEIYVSSLRKQIPLKHVLVHTLRAGQLVAKGNLCRCDHLTSAISGKLEAELLSDVEIPADCWQRDSILVNLSRLEVSADAVKRHFQITAAKTENSSSRIDEWEQLIERRNVYVFDYIQVSTTALFKLFPQDLVHKIVAQRELDDLSDSLSSTPMLRAERRGRPEKFKWNEFYTEIIVRADLDGLPATQAELIEQMAQWCLEAWGAQPSESVLKERTSRIFRHPRRAGK